MLARAAKQPGCLSCRDKVGRVHASIMNLKHKKRNGYGAPSVPASSLTAASMPLLLQAAAPDRRGGRYASAASQHLAHSPEVLPQQQRRRTSWQTPPTSRISKTSTRLPVPSKLARASKTYPRHDRMFCRSRTLASTDAVVLRRMDQRKVLHRN